MRNEEKAFIKSLCEEDEEALTDLAQMLIEYADLPGALRHIGYAWVNMAKELPESPLKSLTIAHAESKADLIEEFAESIYRGGVL